MSQPSFPDRFQRDLPIALRREFAERAIMNEVSWLRQDSRHSDVLIKLIVKCGELFTTVRFEYYGYTRDRDWRFYDGIEYRYKEGHCVYREIASDGRYRQDQVLGNGCGTIPERLRSMRFDSYAGSFQREGGPSLLESDALE